MTGFLERYQQGEYEQVWAELLAMGDKIRSEPLFADALAVAYETMRRVRFNIEILVPRLWEAGYHFGYAWLEERAQYYEQKDWSLPPEALEWVPPDVLADLEERNGTEEAEEYRKIARLPPQPLVPLDPEVGEHLAELEQLVGPIPFSLRAWYELVGQVDFVGVSPQTWQISAGASTPPRTTVRGDQQELGSSIPGTLDATSQEFQHPCDPLLVRPIQQVVALVKYSLRFRRAGEGCSIEIAPDAYFKFFISGGGQYRLTVPSAAIDGELLGEWHHTTFVDYLRHCLRWAGLPGLRYFATERGKEELDRLTGGLLPF